MKDQKFKLTSFYINENNLDYLKIYSIKHKTSLKEVFNSLIILFKSSEDVRLNCEQIINSGSL